MSIVIPLAACLAGIATLTAAARFGVRMPFDRLPSSPYLQEVGLVFLSLAGALLTVAPLLQAVLWLTDGLPLGVTFVVTVSLCTTVAVVLLLVVDAHITRRSFPVAA